MRKLFLYILILILIATVDRAAADDEKTQNLSNQGFANIKSGSYQQAIEDFNQVIHLDPDNAKAVIDFLVKYQENGGTVVFVTHGEAANPHANRHANVNPDAHQYTNVNQHIHTDKDADSGPVYN